MYGELGVQFPCGIGYKIQVLGFGMDISLSKLYEKGCPLHGKDCKKIIYLQPPQPQQPEAPQG